MTKQEAIVQLQNLVAAQAGSAYTCHIDTEAVHLQADGILCDLLESMGCQEVVALFDQLNKWYS